MRKRITFNCCAWKTETEKEIVRELKYLRILTEHTPDGLMIIKPDGSIPYINRRAEEMMATVREKDTGCFDAYGCALPEKALPWLRAAKGERFDSVVVRVVKPDGAQVMSFSASPVVKENQLKCTVLSMRATAEQDKKPPASAGQLYTYNGNSQEPVLKAINRVYKSAFSCRTMEELGKACLKILEELTGSEMSFVGEIGEDGLHHDIAISETGWDRCNMIDRQGHRRQTGDFVIRGLYGSVLSRAETVMTNDPGAHRDGVGLPEGHPRLNSFLGVPYLQDGKVAGMVAVANREGGYQECHKALVEALTPTVCEVLLRKRTETALIESQQKAKILIGELEATKNELQQEVEALNLLHRLNSNFVVKDDLKTIYEELLSATLFITGARKGSIQVYDENSKLLTMILGIGVSDDFLSFFHEIDLFKGTCGEACREKRRVYTGDLRAFASGKPGAALLIREGIVAEQSMPLVSSSGKLVGVLNTYYTDQKQPEDRELRMLDMLARFTADVIERTKTEEELQQNKNHAFKLVEELRDADKNKNIFLSTLSHELRNPVASISAALQLLDIAKDENIITKTRGIIKRELGQLCSLIDDLLDLTRIRMNKIVLKKQVIELNSIAAAAAEGYKLQFDEKDICLSMTFYEHPLYTEADPVRVTQIIGNLLNNALKFTEGEKGRVELTVTREAHDAVISVSDNGIGISPELLPNLFEAFKQADTSHERRNGGLGLGLAIVKGITLLHGGSISVSSDGLGKGACFCIRLPLCFELGADKGNETVKGQPVKRILLIEDNKDLAEVLRTTLQLFGYCVTVANCGAGVICQAAGIKPDIIICDIGLPGIDGYEIARLVRSDSDLKDIYMIALTGYAGTDDVGRALEAGFNCHLPKPLDMTVLKQVLTNLPPCRTG